MTMHQKLGHGRYRRKQLVDARTAAVIIDAEPMMQTETECPQAYRRDQGDHGLQPYVRRPSDSDYCCLMNVCTSPGHDQSQLGSASHLAPTGPRGHTVEPSRSTASASSMRFSAAFFRRSRRSDERAHCAVGCLHDFD